ncbi:hypothetical protein TWF751_004908 [Orbilia oligospora]|nr:hypothetical protein TWF751_004908 [Orbilia oligospora]
MTSRLVLALGDLFIPDRASEIPAKVPTILTSHHPFEHNFPYSPSPLPSSKYIQSPKPIKKRTTNKKTKANHQTGTPGGGNPSPGSPRALTPPLLATIFKFFKINSSKNSSPPEKSVKSSAWGT